MQKQAPAHIIDLRVGRREKEVEVKSLAKRISDRLKKSREGEHHQRPDVTRGSIKYFKLKPKANAPHYMQPGENIGVKINGKWQSCRKSRFG